ncbi:MAG: hypothetical protein Kow0098_18870 [Ignavibacteriaceae bacterium]
MFIYNTKIKFTDCDPAGVMFFGKIFEICHNAYQEMIDSFNLKEDFWTSKKFAVPIIHSEADYLKPLVTGDKIVIEITVSNLKSFMFDLYYECKNEKGEICDRIRTTHVFIDPVTRKKIEMDEELLEKLKIHFRSV